MSKRYREVLQEVETNRTRDEAARAEAERAGEATPARGVATLVRPRPRVVDGRPDGTNPSTSPPVRATRRPDRPGNGPVDADQPQVFAWRGRRYDVTRVLGHWREEEGWWRRPDGEPIRIEQSDLWRVEAVRNGGVARDQRGVYELSRRGDVWRLDRVWD